MGNLNSIRVSAPGRICLFGEHQDYLHLPVIPAAISVRLTIQGQHIQEPKILLNLPDIQSHDSIQLKDPIVYRHKRDYFRSGIRVLQKAGFSFSNGIACIVRSQIPISAGTSSSSALTVAWIASLARLSDQRRQLSSEQIARLAYEAEVLEFREPGGMMDQYCSALGGVLHLSFFPNLKVEQVPTINGAFVLGDSHEPKDTMTILKRVKDRVNEIVRDLTSRFPEFSLQWTSHEDLDRYMHVLKPEQMALLRGTIRNRDITSEGRQLLMQSEMNTSRFGDLLNEHQTILRDVLQISTPKIDQLLDASISAGASGGKINGSGGGGCMFAYAPKNPETVTEAIRRAGGTAHIVSVDSGILYEE